MAKRRRNTSGQFISSSPIAIGSKALILQENWHETAKTFFMVLFLLLMASPWITLAIKSKQIKILISSIFQFYSKHFINAEEMNNGFCTSTKEDI